MALSIALLLPKTHLKEGRRKRKRYFYVRTEEITLRVCHRLDRKSHYQLTPELEFQLTTSTTRAFTLFSQTGHPAERNTFPWVRGKLCPCPYWGLGGNSLSFSPSRQECAAEHSLQFGTSGSSLNCCWLLFLWWFMFLTVCKAHCMHCGHFRCSWKVCRKKKAAL